MTTVIISESAIELFMGMLIFPYAVYCTVGGLKIVKGRQNITLAHYRFLFFLLRMMRGHAIMKAQRKRFLNSSQYKLQGWYALCAGIWMLPVSVLLILMGLELIQ